ncbi:putative methyltransferase, partial [Quercus suber]
MVSSFEPIVVENEVSSSKSILACPICYDSLTLIGNHVLSVESAAGSTLQCNTCKKSFYGNQTHYDMTVSSGAKDYGAPMPPSTEFFRFPLISFLYERGWRQSFSIWGGFPGPEKEFELMRDFLKPALDGNIVDASCGSGLFSRLFAQSGLFSLVIALDYSENMLHQCYEFIKQEETFPKENLILVRADISRLPFVSSSVDAVHAGAALQCWPSPSAAVAEISRVLRPGGVFVATTYIFDGPFAFIPFLRRQRQIIAAVSGSHFFLSERELQDLCTACGLVGFTSIRNGLFEILQPGIPINVIGAINTERSPPIIEPRLP